LIRKRKITRTLIKMREVYEIKRPDDEKALFCRECPEKMAMMPVAEVVAMRRVSSREIYRWIEAGRVHFTETPEGLMLICPYSLLRLI
jgi:hypothetical protein